MLNPLDLIESKTFNGRPQEEKPKFSTLYHGTFNLKESLPIDKLKVTSAIIEKQSITFFGNSRPSGSDANHWFDVLIRSG